MINITPDITADLLNILINKHYLNFIRLPLHLNLLYDVDKKF